MNDASPPTVDPSACTGVETVVFLDGDSVKALRPMIGTGFPGCWIISGCSAGRGSPAGSDGIGDTLKWTAHFPDC
jgi:hypothetical protein